MSNCSPFVLQVAALAAIASPIAWAQSPDSSNPETDSSSSTGPVHHAVDLTTPILEPLPAGGWAVPSAHPRLRPARPHTGQGMEGAEQEPTFSAPLSIREMMTAPLVTEPDDGRVWVRTRDMRASFGEDGFVTYPVFGSASVREWPVHFRLSSVQRGAEALSLTPTTAPAVIGELVTLHHEDLREVYHLALDSIEQTFVFDTLPGEGALTLRMNVETDLQVVDGEELRFVHDALGEVRYGSAFVVDASGARQAIDRTWDGEQITLTVPAAFLAGAVMPVTIDPRITSWINGFGTNDDSQPDVTYAGVQGSYFVCWEEYTSLTNADVYMTSFTPNAAQGNAFAIEMTNDHWATPRVAYIPANNRLLVVASRTPNGPGTTPSAITAQMVNAQTRTLVGGTIFVSTTGSFKIEPDVGGTNRTNPANNHFLVAWSRVLTGATRSIEYRVIDWSGSAVTPIHVVTNTSGERAMQPAISESHGDETLGGDYWTLAWTRDTTVNGRGQIWARRVVWSGITSLGSGNFLVDSSTECSHPAVTSRFDEELLNTNDRPSIIAYQRREGSLFSGFRFSIYARVVVDGHAYPANGISAQEDFDTRLDQFDVSIGTDGTCFLLSYSEDHWSNIGGGNYDMYMLSGHISTDTNDAFLGLAERHKNLAVTTSAETQGRIAMIQDGDNGSTTDDGVCVWMRRESSRGGELRGYTIDCNTNEALGHAAVGIQYCSAVPNSVGTLQGRNRSWLWVRGNQELGSEHMAFAINLPTNSFGYLNCSVVSGLVHMPGGSAGRLCLGGSIGRFVNQVSSSGLGGGIATTIDPLALPQPTGTVSAIPGQTWYFQLWHRDTVNGQSSSNFTNGCAVTFAP